MTSCSGSAQLGGLSSLMLAPFYRVPAAEVECADALTRLLIYAGFRGFDLDGAVAEKRAYNAEREDHKPENRSKEGGKAF
jgi:hypothetical protein